MSLVDRALVALADLDDPSAWHPDEPRTVLLQVDDGFLLRLTESEDGDHLEWSAAPGWLDRSALPPEERCVSGECPHPSLPGVVDGLHVLDDGMVVLTRRWARHLVDRASMREELGRFMDLYVQWRARVSGAPPACA